MDIIFQGRRQRLRMVSSNRLREDKHQFWRLSENSINQPNNLRLNILYSVAELSVFIFVCAGIFAKREHSGRSSQ